MRPCGRIGGAALARWTRVGAFHGPDVVVSCVLLMPERFAVGRRPNVSGNWRHGGRNVWRPPEGSSRRSAVLTWRPTRVGVIATKSTIGRGVTTGLEERHIGGTFRFAKTDLLRDREVVGILGNRLEAPTGPAGRMMAPLILKLTVTGRPSASPGSRPIYSRWNSGSAGTRFTRWRSDRCSQSADAL